MSQTEEKSRTEIETNEQIVIRLITKSIMSLLMEEEKKGVANE